jgi:hypothetical protein
MKKLIRHILKEQSTKLKLLKVIQNEDIFSAAELVGGIDNLRQIFKDNPAIVEKLDTLKGSLNLIYHSRKEFREFPMKFEIVGKGVNTWKTNSWPKINLIYDGSNFSKSEKEMFETFIYDTIADFNVGNVDMNPDAVKMFKDQSYFGIDFVNEQRWERLDHDVKYDDDDIKNLYLKYMGLNNFPVNESRRLTENEEDPTQNILNFLVRRYKFEKKNFGSEDDPLIFKIVSFDLDDEINVISDFQDKKAQIRTIVDMLISHNIIEPIEQYEGRLDPYTQKVIRAVKTFINQVMSDKSNLNESKDETQNKDVNLIKQMIYDLFDEVTSIEVSEYDNKPMLTINLISDSNAANKNTWYDEHISDEVMQMTGGHLVIMPYWAPNWDFRKKIVDVYIDTKVTRIKD